MAIGLRTVWNQVMGRQFRRPQGPLGHWAAGFMEKNNQAENDRVIRLLEVTDQDRVLEIGCGAGWALKLLLTQNAACRVWGVDFSGLMLKKAAKNLSLFLEAGRAQLILDNFSTRDFGTQRFTKIFLINVIYFWEDLKAPLGKLFQLLEPRGRVVIFMSSPERLEQIPIAVKGVFNKRPASAVMVQLKGAGFSAVTETTALKKGQNTH